MKRAFDANVSRARPRTRFAQELVVSEGEPAEAAAVPAKEPQDPPRREPDAKETLPTRASALPVEELRDEARRQHDAKEKLATRESAPVDAKSESSLSADLAAKIQRRPAPAPRPIPRGTEAKLAGESAAKIASEKEEASAESDALRLQEERLARMAGVTAHVVRTEPEVPAWVASSALPDGDVEATSAVRAPSPGSTRVVDARGAEEELSDASSSADLVATLREEARLSTPPKPKANVERSDSGARLSADLAATLLRAAARPSSPASPPAAKPEPEARATTSRPIQQTPGADTVRAGKARIAELRSRLDAASRPRVTAAELAPQVATATVRQAVAELRARLGSAIAERDTLARALEETRDALAAASSGLQTKERALEQAESLAAERARVAEDLVDEAEALAEERDQALARILELKLLDEQQSRLLGEAQESLGAREEELTRAFSEVQELAAALDARGAEAEELSARLAERTAERDAALTRIARLEAEVGGLLGTREALAEIQRLVVAANGERSA